MHMCVIDYEVNFPNIGGIFGLTTNGMGQSDKYREVDEPIAVITSGRFGISILQ